MKEFVLFDLGNTLARYYELRDFPPVLEAAIAQVEQWAGTKADWTRVHAENFEAKDFRVRSLEGRLSRIFPDAQWSDDNALEACRRFLRPIFALAFVYDDVRPTLDALRARAVKTAVVSNTPWGSPAALWREEMERPGLADALDAVVFCPDCGWRKPAAQIFEHTLKRLGATPAQCVFVGDDPRWDVAGPQAVGIEAVLIDRKTQTLPDALKGAVTL